jgi:hypothetical protein
MFKKLFKKKETLYDFNILGLDKLVSNNNISSLEIESILNEYYIFEKEITNKDLSEMLQSNKRLLIDSILKKLINLRKLGEEGKLYKDDYKKIKEMLLKLLFGFFQSFDDIENIDYTFPLLEELKIIPKKSRDEIVKRYCFIGRWF